MNDFPEQENPFASPAMIETSSSAEREGIRSVPLGDLPSRWLRLGAFLLDSLLLLVGIVPLIVVISVMAASLQIDEDSLGTEILSRLVGVAIVLLVYSGINFLPLARTGQTWGKKICGIKIVRSDGSQADLFRLLVVRYFPFTILWQAPFLKILCWIDILYVYSQDKRCLHDRMADTIVVKA